MVPRALNSHQIVFGTRSMASQRLWSATVFVFRTFPFVKPQTLKPHRGLATVVRNHTPSASWVVHALEVIQELFWATRRKRFKVSIALRGQGEAWMTTWLLRSGTRSEADHLVCCYWQLGTKPRITQYLLYYAVTNWRTTGDHFK